MNGERLSQLLPLEGLKVAAGVMLLSPFLPFLFMGEEYAETSPFQYFVSHQDPDLIEAVRQGRRNDFKSFSWNADPPDPQDTGTFLRSRLHWELQERGPHRKLRRFYAELLRLRKQLAPLANSDIAGIEAVPFENDRALFLRRGGAGEELFAVFNFGRSPASLSISLPQANWAQVLNSRDSRWGGPGSSLPDSLPSDPTLSLTVEPLSFALYHSGVRGKP
jgi:maltooligosyltrehalose trehalohydrolase